MRNNNYSHPKWRALRKKALDFYGNRCSEQSCESPSSSTIQVHHKKYVQGGQIWDSPMSDLEVLCPRCHSKRHNRYYDENKVCSVKNCNRSIEPIFTYCFPCSQNLQSEMVDLKDKLQALKERSSIVENKASGTSKKLFALKEINKEQRTTIKALEEKLKNLSRADIEERLDSHNDLSEAVSDAYKRIDNQKEEINKLKSVVKKDEQMRYLIFVMLIVVIVLVGYVATKSDRAIEPITVVVESNDKSDIQQVASAQGFNLAKAKDYLGLYVESEAFVREVSQTSSGVTHINLGGVFPHQLLSLTIFKDDLSAVGELPLAGDKINFNGVIGQYKGKPQILVKSSKQILILN